MTDYHQRKVNARISELNNLSANYKSKIANIKNNIIIMFQNTNTDIRKIEDDIQDAIKSANLQKDIVKSAEIQKKQLNKYYERIPAEKETKLSKEENIYKSEKRRIEYKNNQLDSSTREEKIIIINKLNILRDNIIKLEENKHLMEVEIKVMGRKNLQQRRNVLNQLHTEREKKKVLLAKKKIVDKKIDEINTELNKKTARLIELPECKRGVNALFYKYKEEKEKKTLEIDEINVKIDKVLKQQDGIEFDSELDFIIDTNTEIDTEINNLMDQRVKLEEEIKQISSYPENDIYKVYKELDDEKKELVYWIQVFDDQKKQTTEYANDIQYEIDNPQVYNREDTTQFKLMKSRVYKLDKKLKDNQNDKLELERKLTELENLNNEQLNILDKQNTNAEKRWSIIQTRLENWIGEEKSITQNKIKLKDGEIKSETYTLYNLNSARQKKVQEFSEMLTKSNIDSTRFNKYKKDIKQLEQKIEANNREIRNLQ